MAAKTEPSRKTVSENRRARFDYHIVETYEAGIELKGTEVKSLRKGQSNIAESYAADEGGNIVLTSTIQEINEISPGQPLFVCNWSHPAAMQNRAA